MNQSKFSQYIGFDAPYAIAIEMKSYGKYASIFVIRMAG